MTGTTTYYVGAHYELTGSQVTKYYFAGSQRVAMRKYTIPSSMAVEYFLGDHLGSTSITTDVNGAKVSEMRYKPWGEVRSWWKVSKLTTTPAYKLPEYSFTGQFSYMDDLSTGGVTEGFGLMFYVSRFYDPVLGRFIQADSIVPGGVQGLDRYAYVNNSPVIYIDPSGHTSNCSSISNGYARQQCNRANANEELYDAYQNGVETGDWATFDDLLGIELTTDGTATWDTKEWNGDTFSEDVAVRAAAMDVAFGLGSLNSNISASDAFRNAYGTSADNRLEFRKVSSFEYEGGTYTEGGVTPDAHLIKLADLSNWYFESARNNVVHELGHALNQASGGNFALRTSGYIDFRGNILQSGTDIQLRFNTSPSSGEVYADFFVAFIYGTWTSHPLSGQVNLIMTTDLSVWIH